MVKSMKRYYQLLSFTILVIIISSQNLENNSSTPTIAQMNSAPLRSGVTRKTAIINEISNDGRFKFNARYNHNQVVVEGLLYDYYNGTKELQINGRARVVLFYKGFNSQLGGGFQTYDYDYVESACPQPVGGGVPGGFTYASGIGFKTAQTILG